ncbi:MAG TPA: phosphatase PAP2 family protein [Gemmatimonadaceae bacterium]|jgi:undecaprenyl-diphosphatase|nr:phosphatase PAP2 family protein [Gemmatimonadaceae bacterium]
MSGSERPIAARSSVGAAIGRFWNARVDRHSAVGLRLTLGIVVFAAAVWSFAGLLEEVLDNESLVRWDTMASEWVHQHTSTTGLAIFNAITTLGSVGVWAVVVIVAAWLWRTRHRVLFSGWIGTNLGGLLVQLTIKRLVHRVRPEYAGDYLHGHTFSFPSGHAMQSTIAFVMLVLVASAVSPWWRARRRAMLIAAVGLVLLISYSRVYLGVHYPSDVVGGIVAGTAWLAAALILLGLVRSRRNHVATDVGRIQPPSGHGT